VNEIKAYRVFRSRRTKIIAGKELKISPTLQINGGTRLVPTAYVCQKKEICSGHSVVGFLP